MDTMIDAHAPGLHTTGWREGGEGGEGGAGTSSEGQSAPSPQVLDKRRRLSQLLAKLVDQMRHNNRYSGQWVVEEAPLDLSVRSAGCACTVCGQTFTARDRLAKHVASRHRSGAAELGVARAHQCAVCRRRFARSDMLTRHARLHTGLKPYSCSVCGQVFSRSDHLATHQRTHTGEKPYQCPECPYAACRRDMITRHMRTHSKRAR